MIFWLIYCLGTYYRNHLLSHYCPWHQSLSGIFISAKFILMVGLLGSLTIPCVFLFCFHRSKWADERNLPLLYKQTHNWQKIQNEQFPFIKINFLKLHFFLLQSSFVHFNFYLLSIVMTSWLSTASIYFNNYNYHSSPSFSSQLSQVEQWSTFKLAPLSCSIISLTFLKHPCFLATRNIQVLS